MVEWGKNVRTREERRLSVEGESLKSKIKIKKMFGYTYGVKRLCVVHRAIKGWIEDAYEAARGRSARQQFGVRWGMCLCVCVQRLGNLERGG